jgi:HEAT repeat protein
MEIAAMRAIVAVAILLLVILLAGLILYILLRRGAIGLWNSFEKKRRARLVVATDRWLTSNPESMPAEIARLRLVPDRSLFIELCLERLPGAPVVERQRMVKWLKTHGMVQGWIRQLGHRSNWRRGRAAEILGILRDPDSAPALAETLADPEFDVRMRAAKALGAVGGERARRALVGALADENRWSVIRISDLLAEMGPVVVNELVEAFPAMGRASRIATIDLLAHVGNSGATPFLVARLDDLDRDIRARAAAALGRIGDDRAVSGLLAALQDAEWPVRSMAAKALGDRKVIHAVDSLQASLRDPEWWVRSNAADALRRLEAPGIDALIAALDAPDQFARDQALGMLESIGEIDRRLAAITSTDRDANDSARRLLASLADHQTEVRMQMICARQPDLAVRTAIGEAMARVAGKSKEVR